MTLLDKMLAKVGKTRLDVNPHSRLGKELKQQGVQPSAELTRILAIPRRRWEEYALEELTDLLHAVLRKPGSTMALRPLQAAALQDLHDFGGLTAPVRVGGGKTLISFLAGTVMEAERPLVLVPGGLTEKTRRDFAKLAREWEAHPNLRVESYERLGKVNGIEVLEEIAPDLLILDEAHRVKNPQAAVTKRVKRWMDEHPETRMVAMSGTMISRSINDYGHILEWCLPKHAPVPKTFVERQRWALAVDEKLPPNAERLLPGALKALQNEDENAIKSPLVAVRRAFRRRVTETPGVIATEEGFVGCSLRIEALEFTPSEDIGIARCNLLESWERPDGEPLTSPAEVWRCARELALGFFYKWDPPAPKDWRDARRMWGSAVRHVLGHNQRQLDSELPVARACARGEYDDAYVVQNGAKVFPETIGEIYRTWVEIKPTFEPNTVPMWIDDTAIETVAEWMKNNKGIVWVEHRAFAHRLSAKTGRPYFGQKGLDTSGKFIDDQNPAEGSIIASVAANSAGRNLQAWSKSLVVSPEPNGLLWEQMLGRLHRDGQEADEVSYEVLIGTREQYDGFEGAVSNGFFVQDMTGQAQKICCADKVMPDPEEVASRDGDLWTK